MLNKVKVFKWSLFGFLLLIVSSFSNNDSIHANTFSDVPDDYWATPQIHHLYDLGLVSGYPDGTFKPEAYVSRSEMVVLLLRTAGQHEPAIRAQPPFIDVDATHWARHWINTAYAYELVSGYPGGLFQPDHVITRAEAASMLARVFQLESNVDYNRDSVQLADVPTDHWAYDALLTLANLDIIKTDASGKVYPEAFMTRADQAYWISELLQNKVQQYELKQPTTYEINLNTWTISNDGTHPVETTQGINRALKWAANSGFQITTLPTGTYLIDKDNHIEMVGNMTFRLDDDTIIQKETNGSEKYYTLYIGYGADNVVIEGGSYRGDRETHDYSGKDPLGPGTHEGGYGIYTDGATNVTIKGVKATHYTGDGLALFAHITMIKELYASNFTVGSFSETGKPIQDDTKIRTIEPIPLTHDILKKEPYFELSNAQHLANTFDLYFYDENGQFIHSMSQINMREWIEIPDGATSVHVVFHQSSAENAYVEVWNRVVSKNITVKDSEFAFNRRQGITVGGADQVLIENNEIHDIQGTAPQSGIDVEGGFWENGNRNSNIHIRNNRFYNNATYDIILYDGQHATIEGNYLGSKGVIGLAISEPFRDATVKDNHFDGSRIFAYRDATFINNRMNDSFTSFMGPNITIDGMTMIDSMLSISSAVPNGVKVSNVTIEQTGKSDYALSLWSNPIQMQNITIQGKSNIRTFQGGIEDESTFENLILTDYDGADLPSGTYRNCHFQLADDSSQGIVINNPGKYIFENCEFTGKEIAIWIDHEQADVTIRDSQFEMTGDTSAISIQKAGNVTIENSHFTVLERTQIEPPIIKVGDYWDSEEQNDIHALTVRDSSFEANLSEVIAISTIYTGKSAPSYDIKGNNLNNTTLQLKEHDHASQNISGEENM